MIRVVPAGVVLCLVGCNQIYGLEGTTAPGTGTDIDLDGVPDDMDPCIASAADMRDDTDSDGVTNDVDLCPIDMGGTDGDGDQIPENCDPFPGVTGDRHRCTMTFKSADLNERMWVDDTKNWMLVGGLVTTNVATLVASHDLDGAAEATIDVFANMSPPPLNTHEMFVPEFRLWIRTGSGSDLGCAIAAVPGGGSTLAIVDGTKQLAVVSGSYPTVPFRMVATFASDTTGGDNVRCRFRGAGDASPTEVRTRAPIPNGHVGFDFNGSFGYGSITTLAIYERDTPAAF